METTCFWDRLLGHSSECQDEEERNMAGVDGMEIPGKDITTGEVWTTLPGNDMSRDISWSMITNW